MKPSLSVLIDPVHFTPTTFTFSAVAMTMKSEYKAGQWQLIAQWQPKCAASIPYPLFKYKDIVATCARLMSLPLRGRAVGADLWCRLHNTQHEDC